MTTGRAKEPAADYPHLGAVAARMPLMLTASLHDARLPVELATSVLCGGRSVEPGMPADILVWDPEPAWTLTPATRMPSARATITSGTVDIPTASAPSSLSIFTSLGVS